MANESARPALSAADLEFAELCSTVQNVISMGLVAHRGFRSAVDWMRAAIELPASPCGPRLFTGYYPEAQRRATRHLSRSNGLPVVS